MPLYRDFCGLDSAQTRLLDESTTLKPPDVPEGSLVVR